VSVRGALVSASESPNEFVSCDILGVRTTFQTTQRRTSVYRLDAAAIRKSCVYASHLSASHHALHCSLALRLDNCRERCPLQIMPQNLTRTGQSCQQPSTTPSFCVTVYGSSSSAIDDSFKVIAKEVGAAIALKGWVQVNGGGAFGLVRVPLVVTVYWSFHATHI
jgi:hypothetical protein